MNAKIGSIVVALLLLCVTVGGCPQPVDVGDGSGTPASSGTAGSSGDAASSGDANADSGPSGSSSGDDSAGSDTSGSTSGTSGTETGGSDSGSASDAGGSDTGGDSGAEPAPPAFAGTYSGEVTCTKREAFGFGGALGHEDEWVADFSITFDENGMATGFVVYRFGQSNPGLEVLAEVKDAGDSVVLDLSSGDHDLVLTVAVASATYDGSSANVMLNLTHVGQEFARTEDGTGIEVVQFELDGDTLEFHSVTTWEMKFGVLDMTWQVECEGTLSPE